MAPAVSEDEIDDLLYLARTGDAEEFNSLKNDLCAREKIKFSELLEVAKDDVSGNGVLHMVSANGHDSLLNDICKVLSDPTPQNPTLLAILNTQNKAGNTALHWAALNGHLKAVKTLLEQGADPTITNQKGHDAIYEAELSDRKEVVEWILKESEAMEQGLGGDGEENDVDGEAEVEENTPANDQELKVEEDLEKLDIQTP